MKNLKKLLAAVLALTMLCLCAACTPADNGTEGTTTAPTTTGSTEKPVDTKAEVLKLFESLKTGKADGLNTYESSYEDVLAYLIEKGVIAADVTPVDMNVTEGYITDNTGGQMPVAAIADKANDYNGVYLLWWDMKNPTDNIGSYTGLKLNGMVVIMGGAATFDKISANSGCFAIGFAEGTAEATVTAGVEAFNAIDKTANSLDYMTSAVELATALKEAGLIEGKDIAGAKDLNGAYTYKTTTSDWDDAKGDWGDPYEIDATVFLASEAMQFGKVTIFYFDTLGGLWGDLEMVYNELQSSNTIKPYCQLTMDSEYIPYTHKDGVYDAAGEALSITVDAVYGRYAIVISE